MAGRASRQRTRAEDGRRARASRASQAPADGGGFLDQMRWPSVFDPEIVGARRRLFAMIALVGLLFANQVWVSLRAQELGYVTRDLSSLIEKLDQERLELEDWVARESSPAMLASKARDLGLEKARPGQVRRIHAQP